jgi:hypothetical protein
MKWAEFVACMRRGMCRVSVRKPYEKGPLGNVGGIRGYNIKMDL